MTDPISNQASQRENLHGNLIKWIFIAWFAGIGLIMANDIRALLSGELDFQKERQIQKQSQIQGKGYKSKPAARDKQERDRVK